MRHTTDHYYNAAVLALAACAVVVAIVTVPTHRTIADILISDRNFGHARSILEGLHEQRDDDLHLSVALHDMHLRFGDIEKAKAVLVHAMNAHPDNAELFALAVRFFENIQDPDSKLDALLRVMEKRPSSETLDRILELFRLFNNEKGEENLLLQYEQSHLLTNEHHAKLGFILAQRTKFEEAIVHLIKADAMQQVPNWRVRANLFHLLALNGRPDDARTLATSWLEDPIDKDQISFFAHELLTAGRKDLVVELLTRTVVARRITDAQAKQILSDLEIF